MVSFVDTGVGMGVIVFSSSDLKVSRLSYCSIGLCVRVSRPQSLPVRLSTLEVETTGHCPWKGRGTTVTSGIPLGPEGRGRL